jgi:hypothetical protein
MGLLFDKDVEEYQATDKKPIVIVLEKYKAPVIISKIDVDDDDDANLQIEFSHDIDAPQDEIADELGKVIIEKIEKGLSFDMKGSVVDDLGETK